MHPKYGKVGLLLNGGGAKGIIQAGAIEAFLHHGIEHDASWGSSVGAINGSVLQQGQPHLLRDVWMNVKNSDVYSWSPFDLRRLIAADAALYDSSPLLKLITRYIDYKRVIANPKPFHVAATSLNSWSAVIHESKELTRDEFPMFVYASASPPVFFPCVNFQGDRLVDAGLLQNYCITEAIRAGMDTIIIIGFAVPEPHRATNIKEVLSQTLAISMFGYFNRELESVEQINTMIRNFNEIPAANEVKIVRIVPDVPTGIPFLDFDHRGKDKVQLFNYGYNLAREVLQRELPCT